MSRARAYRRIGVVTVMQSECIDTRGLDLPDCLLYGPIRNPYLIQPAGTSFQDLRRNHLCVLHRTGGIP